MKTRRLDYGARAAYRGLVSRLEREGVPRGARILDYGCGSGTLVEYLRQAGYDAKGYDPHVPDHSTDTLLHTTYDVVVSVDVLEHEEDPADALRRLTTLVRPGGWVLLSTPNATGIDLKRPDYFALAIHAPYHRHILSPEALLRLAAQAGLSISNFSRRHVTDTPWPLANFALFREYTRRIDNTLDAAFDPPRYDLLWRHPRLVFWGLLGYFFGDDSQMTALFRRSEKAMPPSRTNRVRSPRREIEPVGDLGIMA
ncbi:MAG: class I SAM-dependent methyltransferase [Elusimicrobia bacterium]|nr:class I SAM-dependent methyltransferase [Elusimicrobiota bacterium]